MAAPASNKFSLVVVGGGGVGKSAITLSFMRNQFVVEYDPTIEDSYCKVCTIDGQECTLDITDTAGQEEYRGLWGDKFMRSGDGFILVYSITSKTSLEELSQFRDQIFRAKDADKCPMIILGNKCDLESFREVQESEGRDFAKQAGALFLETSAKERINIDEAFYDLVREIRRSGKSAGAEGARESVAGKKAAAASSDANRRRSGGNPLKALCAGCVIA